MQDTIKDEVKKMLEFGVIEPADSEYCSNSVITSVKCHNNRLFHTVLFYNFNIFAYTVSI